MRTVRVQWEGPLCLEVESTFTNTKPAVKGVDWGSF